MLQSHIKDLFEQEQLFDNTLKQIKILKALGQPTNNNYLNFLNTEKCNT